MRQVKFKTPVELKKGLIWDHVSRHYTNILTSHDLSPTTLVLRGITPTINSKIWRSNIRLVGEKGKA